MDICVLLEYWTDTKEIKQYIADVTCMPRHCTPVEYCIMLIIVFDLPFYCIVFGRVVGITK